MGGLANWKTSSARLASHLLFERLGSFCFFEAGEGYFKEAGLKIMFLGTCLTYHMTCNLEACYYLLHPSSLVWCSDEYIHIYIHIIYTNFFIPIFPSDTPQQFWLETCKCTTWLSVPRLLKIVVLECSIPTQKLGTPPFEFVACTQKHSITLRKNLIVTSITPSYHVHY